MRPIYRHHSLTGEDFPTLEHIHTFKNFPVFMGTTSNPPSDDILFDMNIYINQFNGILQVNPILPLDIIYETDHNSGAIGEIWKNHHISFAKYIEKFNPSDVFEIGGGSGILSETYVNHINSWTILEPNPTPNKNHRAEFIKGFFDKDFIYSKKFDIVVHSHVLEHMYDPMEFLHNISKFTNDNHIIIFSIPNMKNMLERGYLNFINFEHTFYINESHIQYMLETAGFKIIDKEYYLDDHSIFYSTVKNRTVNVSPLPADLYQESKYLFEKYIRELLEYVQRINTTIKNSDHPVFQFGAHIFTQYLINCGLDVTKISSIIDNDVQKQNKRLYGTQLYVKSPKVLAGLNSPIVILRAGIYNKEIKSNILENINSTTQFLE